MKRQKLVVEKRKILGKKIKKLRREGILPANVYGKDIKSVAVQMPFKEFNKVFKEAGETGLIDLDINGKVLPVLIHNVQTTYLGELLHADFYKVNLKEKVKTMVPVITTGEAKAVTDKVGLLIQVLSELEVEALPEDLPEKIEINVEKLSTVDEQITVGDIKTPNGAAILTDSSQIVVKISELVSKEAEEQAAAEAAAAEEAKAEAAAGAGEVSPEAEEAVKETPIEEKAAEEKPGEKNEEKPKAEEKSQQ